MVSALQRKRLTEELYDYFHGLISSLPVKIKRELLQKRLRQLMPQNPVMPQTPSPPPPARKPASRTRAPKRPADSPDPASLPNYHASFSVAGTMFAPRELLKTVQPGAKVALVREKDNEYDKKAILVLDQADQKLGYIPRAGNAKLADAMDAGEAYYGLVFDTDMKTEYPLIAIDVFEEE